ncbi:VOC family protein [Amycolatopsis anabasis]|uniref:VOC family protein n=1 Tax=Amycolatopsis anabasis TaxID=1840409 RepID=UPI00131AB4D9|nr:VOC family protein [Amycolatopsis anabasis]
MSTAIDHLVYATPALADTVAVLRAQGVDLAPGGPHPGLGTRNFLAGLGEGCYLEVIGPDPEQPAPDIPRPFGIDELTGPRLVAWAARVTGLDEVIERARAAGYDPGAPFEMSRRRPDGVLLRWRLAFSPEGAGVVPFLIDWGSSPHPAETTPDAGRLVTLRGVHPDPARVAAELAAIGQELAVTAGPEPALEAVLATADGGLVLR